MCNMRRCVWATRAWAHGRMFIVAYWHKNLMLKDQLNDFWGSIRWNLRCPNLTVRGLRGSHVCSDLLPRALKCKFWEIMHRWSYLLMLLSMCSLGGRTANSPLILSGFLIYTLLPLLCTYPQTPDGNDMYLFDQNTLGSMFQFSENRKEIKLV